MRTLSQHIEEKLVINNDLKNRSCYNSKYLFELEFLWDDQWNRALMTTYVREVEEIKDSNSSFYGRDILLKYTDRRFRWGFDVNCDYDLQIFYRKLFTQMGHMVCIYFTDKYKDKFLNLCEQFLEKNKYCTAENIFKQMYIGFNNDDTKKVIDSVTKNSRKYRIKDNELITTIYKLKHI